MRWLRFSWERCLRSSKKAILNLLISLVTVMLINVFAGNIFSILDQMKKLPEAMEVDAIICNLCGNMDEALKIKEENMDGVLAAKYVVDPVFAMQVEFGFGEFNADNYRGNLVYIARGSNEMAGIPGMREEDLTLQDHITSEQFFASSDRIIILDQKMMQAEGYKIGDEVEMTTFYYRYGKRISIYTEYLETGTFTVVGSMDIENYTGNSSRPNAILPIETIRTIYHEQEKEFFAASGSFRIEDLYHLNDLKEEMRQIGFVPVAFQGEFAYDGCALTIKDEIFIKSAEQLIKNRNLMLVILPFVVAAVMCIGFVMAELLMKSRMPEYAIMRSLGQTHRESLKMLIGEYGITALLGSVLGAVLGIVIFNTVWYAALLAGTVFFICYMIGTLAAMSALKKLSIMTVLSKND